MVKDEVLDLSWIEKLIDKPSKAMGVYRTLLYMILKAPDVSTFGASPIDHVYNGREVTNQPIIRDFIDKHFVGKPSEAREVTIAINEFCNNIINILNETGAYRKGPDDTTKRKSIFEKIEETYYDKFLNAFKYYLKFDIIPTDVRNIIHQFILDCKSNLYEHKYELTQIGTLRVEIGSQSGNYESYFGEHLAKFYGIREESKIKEILSYLINSGLAITWRDWSRSGNTLYDYLIIPAPCLSNEILRSLER